MITKTLLLIMLLAPASAQAQAQPAPKGAQKASARAADPCVPIGRTAKGELVYSMKCENLPVSAQPVQTEVRDVQRILERH